VRKTLPERKPEFYVVFSWQLSLHWYIWHFQLCIVILPSNPLQLAKCFDVHLPFSAGCECWTLSDQDEGLSGCHRGMNKTSPLWVLNFSKHQLFRRRPRDAPTALRGPGPCARWPLQCLLNASPSRRREQLYLLAGKRLSSVHHVQNKSLWSANTFQTSLFF
jgi:hypothetical protein